jgi:hypothetical protein
MKQEYFDFGFSEEDNLKNCPKVPFQMYVSDLEYAIKYNLPFKQVLTCTDKRFIINKKQVRYTIIEAIFDFPWKDDSLQILNVCSTN